MWETFYFGIFVGSLFLLVPGAFLLRALQVTPFLSFAGAPIISLAEYGIGAIVLSMFGIPCDWKILFFGASGVNLLVLATVLLLQKFLFKKPYPWEQEWGLWASAVLYVVLAIIITIDLFVGSLDSTVSFIPDNDAISHLSTVRRFLVTGDWSILSAAYYPQAYSELAAMLAQVLAVSPPFAANIVVAVVLCAVLPLSVLGFFGTVFQEKPLAVACGCIVPLAFAGYPWNFLEINQIGPNLLGLATAPMGLAFFIRALQPRISIRIRCSYVLAFIFFVISAVFSHPNIVFTCGVLLVPYIMYRIIAGDAHSVPQLKKVPAALIKVLAVMLFLGCVAAIWVFCFNLPFLANVVNFHWKPYMTPFEAVANVAFFAYDNPAQWVVALLVGVGIVYTLARRKYLWMTVGFLIFGVLYVISASIDGEMRGLFIGFWYGATRRLSGAACFAAMPLLCLGCYAACLSAANGFIAASKRIPIKVARGTISAVVLACIAAAIYCPSFVMAEPMNEVETTFGYIYDSLKEGNDPDNGVLGNEERAFLNEVSQIVGDDIVFNDPFDGSAYAYALNGIRATCSSLNGNTKEALITMQKGIDEIATDADVQQAAKATGVKYVLLLDEGPLYRGNPTLHWHLLDEDAWSGMLSLDEETPGLEQVLHRGDMALYRIDPALLE